MADHAEDLVDYDEDEETVPVENTTTSEVVNDVADVANEAKEVKKGSYVGIHATGFKDFMLKPELSRAIVDCGFEHPSEGKHPFCYYKRKKDLRMIKV